MRFLLIRPEKIQAELLEYSDVPAALEALGLRQGEIDHGMVSEYLGIMVYEYGFLRPLKEQRLFSIWGQLFCGDALVYGGPDCLVVDATDDTITMAWQNGEEYALPRGCVRRVGVGVNRIGMEQMIFFVAPFAALSVLAALPAAIFVSAMTRGRTRGPRCPACEATRCAECIRLDAERARRFGRRG